MNLTIENDNTDLRNLLEATQAQAARKQDYIAPTTELLCRTVKTPKGNRTQVVLEGKHGDPTKVLEANPTAFEQM